MAQAIQTISLATSSATYDIAIGRGLLRTLHPRLVRLAATHGQTGPFRPFLITSPNIWALWSQQVLASFPESHAPTVLFIPAGEKHKRLPTLAKTLEQLAKAGADRDALLIAFGGGVIGDMTGFLAAIYMRGVPFVQIPTTLLAQVDSSVGGKTGVNLAAGKNLVGSFNQPRAVYADIDLLATLPPPELRAGLQESIKAGIIADPRLFRLLETSRDLILAGDPVALAKVITASVKVKAAVVAADEKERSGGPRMTLNFGHTIGHAIEAATGYRKLLHGQAIAWGMIAALHVGLNRRSITPDQFARIANLIFAYGPLPGFRASAAQLVALTSADKKNRSGRRAFILPIGIGSTEVVFDVTIPELTAATQSMLDEMKSSTSTSRVKP